MIGENKMKRVIKASEITWMDVYQVFTDIANYVSLIGADSVNEAVEAICAMHQGEPAFDKAWEKWTA